MKNFTEKKVDTANAYCYSEILSGIRYRPRSEVFIAGADWAKKYFQEEIKNILSEMNYKKHLEGLDGPTVFAESQAKGHVIGDIQYKLKKLLGE